MMSIFNPRGQLRCTAALSTQGSDAGRRRCRQIDAHESGAPEAAAHDLLDVHRRDALQSAGDDHALYRLIQQPDEADHASAKRPCHWWSGRFASN